MAALTFTSTVLAHHFPTKFPPSSLRPRKGALVRFAFGWTNRLTVVRVAHVGRSQAVGKSGTAHFGQFGRKSGKREMRESQSSPRGPA